MRHHNLWRMADDTSIFVGAGESDQYLLLKYGNRHGLIAGATAPESGDFE